MTLDRTFVDDVLAANILADRVATARDPMRESIALDILISRINGHPEGALQALVETSAELSGAGSAGASLLEGDRVVWRVIAGAWNRYVGEGLPFDASPCGVVIERNAPLLFSEPHRHFPELRSEPPIREALLVPLRGSGRPIGTLWVLSHDRHRFDTEDVRLLERLARFATAIEQMRRSRAERADALDSARTRIRDTIAMIRSITRGALEDDLLQPHGEALARFGARVRAYADAVPHDLPEISGDLWLLIASTLTRHGEQPGDRVILEGPAVAIEPDRAGPLGLAFHELLDNAFRHGALSTSDGRVEVRWGIVEKDEGPWLRLGWYEHTRPRRRPAKPKPGFGFELLTQGLPEMLGARTSVELRPEGLRFALDMPLHEPSRPAAALTS